MRLALFEPDIPQNTGTLLRLGACVGVAVDIIEPCGFLFTDRGLKRAGMDYLELANYRRHDSWAAFEAQRKGRTRFCCRPGPRIRIRNFASRPTISCCSGRESAGVPDSVRDAADARLRIPLMPGLRSLNVALAASMVLGEALRQTEGFPA